MKHFKEWPKWMQIQECILLFFVILYIIGIVTGGLFTSFYGAIALLVVSIITALISLFKRRFLLALCNLLIGLASFLLYVSLPV